MVKMWIEVKWMDQRLTGSYTLGDGCSVMLLSFRDPHFPDMWLPDFEFNWSNTGGYQIIVLKDERACFVALI